MVNKDEIYTSDGPGGVGLMNVRPRFEDFGERGSIFIPVEKIPDPLKVSPVDPDVISFTNVNFYNTTLAWDDFVRGVACVAHVAEHRDHHLIQMGLEMYVEAMDKVPEPMLPAVNQIFEVSVSNLEDIIFSNGEPQNWRSLLSFAIGCYWVLGLIKRPETKRGNMSPLEFVERLTHNYALLAYTPKG